MKRLRLSLLIGIAVGIFIQSSFSAFAGPRGGLAPGKTKQGNKWRIGYYEGGDYNDYHRTLRATVRALMELGWIRNNQTQPSDDLTSSQIWRWLSTRAESDYLQFVPDAFYSAKWDPEERTRTAPRILERLTRKRDIQLMIAMGTWAGQDLANNRHNVPTLVMSTTDPLAAGIIKSVGDSGFDHVHAHVDPNRSGRQVNLFHQIAGYTKLGIIYENSVAGRSYAAVDALEKLADRRGFEIVPCHAESDIPDVRSAEKAYLNCFEKLATTADAIYVSAHGGVTARSLPRLVDLAVKHRIPTFSQSGPEEVRAGILMSLSPGNYQRVGVFEAAVIANVLNGAKPRALAQVFEEPSLLAVNLKTAELIGFYDKLTLGVLASCDMFFHEIVPPK